MNHSTHSIHGGCAWGWLALLALSLVSAGPVAQQTAPPTTAPIDGAMRFAAMDVYLDSNRRPLGAYQIEIRATAGDVALVGLEGGAHPAFAAAPYYDPGALLRHRVIFAAFSTAADLPRGKTRIARLMLREQGAAPPAFAVKVQAAASGDGKPIDVNVTLRPVSEGADR